MGQVARSSLLARARPTEVVLGQVVGTFGLRGEVRVFLYNPDGDFGSRSVVLVDADGNRTEAVMHLRRGSGRRILARLDGIKNREAAAAIVDAALVVTRDALPDLDDGEFYHSDLIGRPVHTTSGRLLGKLVAIHSQEVDVWEIKGEGEARYIPALKDLVDSVSSEGIVVKDEAATDAI